LAILGAIVHASSRFDKDVLYLSGFRMSAFAGG
jgi:hypothetical protein